MVVIRVESGKLKSAARAYKLVTENPELHLRGGVQLHKVLDVE